MTFFHSIEEQVQAMTFGDETGDYSSLFNGNAFQSIDSKQFNNKLSIEETYAEIRDDTGDKSEEQKDSLKDSLLVEYATVDFNKKREARRKKSLNFCEASATNNSNRTPAIIYEDVGTDEKISNEDNNIYELVSFVIKIHQNKFFMSFLITRLRFLYVHRGNHEVLFGKTGHECICSTSRRDSKTLMTVESHQVQTQSKNDRRHH